MVHSFTSLSPGRHVHRVARALGVIGGLLLSAAPAMSAELDAKESLAQLRAYLPTIRRKALLDIERDHAAKLERQLQLYEMYLEGGMASQPDKAEIEDAFLQAQRRVLQRDREYRDSRDEFTLRFHLPSEYLRKMEDAAITPLTRQFQGFEDLSHDGERVAYEVLKSGRDKDVTKVRAVIVRNLTVSALVKNTALPKRLHACWDQFKDAALAKLGETCRDKRKEASKLRTRRGELEAARQKVPEADLQRLDDLRFDIEVCELSRNLLTYEKQPWDHATTPNEGLLLRNSLFRGMIPQFLFVLDRAFQERHDRLLQAWPNLAPAQLQDVDLLTCERDKAEQAVASTLKTPEARLVVKKKVRQLRELAECYQTLLQRSFQLNYLRREHVYYGQLWLPSSQLAAPETGIGDKAGPVGQRPQPKDLFAAETVLRAEASYATVKRQILLTWIDYQMVRLDLYHDLGESPPSAVPQK